MDSQGPDIATGVTWPQLHKRFDLQVVIAMIAGPLRRHLLIYDSHAFHRQTRQTWFFSLVKGCFPLLYIFMNAACWFSVQISVWVLGGSQISVLYTPQNTTKTLFFLYFFAFSR
jgi:hypothetical protein